MAPTLSEAHYNQSTVDKAYFATLAAEQYTRSYVQPFVTTYSKIFIGGPFLEFLRGKLNAAGA